METTRRSYARPVAAPVTTAAGVEPDVLLVGPYDPAFVEDACLAPPLGVWRSAGVLGAAGARVQVFDPNCCDEAPRDTLTKILISQPWRLIAFSVTAATLRSDHALAQLARRLCNGALIVAFGTEAALMADTLLRLGAFDLVVLGQAERPLLEIADRFRQKVSIRDVPVPGTAWIDASGQLHRRSQPAPDRQAFRDATFLTPYARMPLRRYWDKLTDAYKLHDLPVRAERDARLAEVQAVRIDTLAAGPGGTMGPSGTIGAIGTGCACSPAGRLNEALNTGARATRLEADECVSMVAGIVSALPDVRTIVFEDDVFVFTSDQRVRPLCEGLMAAKRAGDIPAELQFISRNRIDSMDESRLALLKRAGFRILEFGVDSFSRDMLLELEKEHIWESIAPNLQAALKLGITPFLDLLLTTPQCSMKDVAFNVTTAFKWLQHGCEARLSPYIVNPTSIELDEPEKILPIEPSVHRAVLEIERTFVECLTMVEAEVARLPSRVRSVLWIACAIPVLTARGEAVPGLNTAVRAFVSRLPVPAARASKLAAVLTGMIGGARSLSQVR